MVHAHPFVVAFGDPSVGLYLTVAEAWRHGSLPYLAVWEYKPPGLFAAFALALTATGDRPSLAVALLGTLATLGTALALWRLGPIVDAVADPRTGRFAALFAVLLSTEDEGDLADAEVLLDPFVATAFLVAAGRPTLARAALAGLLSAGALQMKLTALPIVVVVALVLVRSARARAPALLIFAVALVAPFACEALLYAHAGVLGAFVDANLGATWRRTTEAGHGVLRENIPWFVAQVRLFAPALEFALLALGPRTSARPLLTWGWLAAALGAVAGVGEFYDRQFILTEAPLALLGGLGLRAALSTRPLRSRANALAAATFVVTFALHDYWQIAQAATLAYHRDVLQQRSYREEPIATLLAALRRCGAERGGLLVIQASPLVYGELGLAAPTRFPYTDHLLDPRMWAMTGQDGGRELARLFAAHPRLVAAGSLRERRFDPATVAAIRRHLARDYRRVDTLPEGLAMYQRRGSAVMKGCGSGS